ncbi:hypothetical protein HYW82_00725 [Candidatus Peregrinibacteria bacterium]|nr:hypothetical protein [Candidatus Peregrinibacteria bacterium]
MKKRSWFKFVLTLFLAMVVFLIWYFGIGLSANEPGSFYNKGHNAAWIGHEWLGEKKSNQEIKELIQNLTRHEIDLVFVHAGPLMEDGNIDPDTYNFAFNFIDKARKFDKNIRYQAWLGQLRSKINLADEEVRKNIAKQALIFSGLIGFDGVHFDIEPVWDGDLDFIELLKETRVALPDEKKISVALAEFIPQSLILVLKNFREFENFNSEVNYRNVAKYADQIVVMAYDTGINSGWLYCLLVREQTIWLSNLLAGKELLVGIPSYDEEKESFNPKVENIENGLKGITSGLNNFRSNEDNFTGVAIYPYWEIDAEEWEIYESLWQK